MTRLPEALMVIDPHREHIAVAEARKLGIKVVALLDTDCDPDAVDLPIPGNDDSMRSIELVIKRLTDAIIEGAPPPRPSRPAERGRGRRARGPAGRPPAATVAAAGGAGRRGGPGGGPAGGISRSATRTVGQGTAALAQGAEAAEQEPAPAEPAEIAPAAVEAAIPGSGGETDIPPSAE